MWYWIKDRQRKKILETPFPREWENLLEKNVAHYQRLDEKSRRELRDLTQVFISEKNWEGCGGLILTDEMRVTIAAQACLLILRLPHDLYRGVDSILVYPSTVVLPERKLGFFEVHQGLDLGSTPILGLAERHGPVVLVWDFVQRTARRPESGHNVVYHEFAHKLDLLDGQADGTPPLKSREDYRRWIEICSKEFLKLRTLSSQGKHTFLDSYGAVNEAEFFAVVTEQFFDQPVAMKKKHPELYNVLSRFYLQDPAELEHKSSFVHGE